MQLPFTSPVLLCVVCKWFIKYGLTTGNPVGLEVNTCPRSLSSGSAKSTKPGGLYCCKLNDWMYNIWQVEEKRVREMFLGDRLEPARMQDSRLMSPRRWPVTTHFFQCHCGKPVGWNRSYCPRIIEELFPVRRKILDSKLFILRYILDLYLKLPQAMFG